VNLFVEYCTSPWITYLILYLTGSKVSTLQLYMRNFSCCHVEQVRVADSDFSSESHQSFRVRKILLQAVAR
jgi:hypothetical protein